MKKIENYFVDPKHTVHQKAFGDIKEVIVRDVVLAYPDFDDTFEIYTNMSYWQLGAVITQKNGHLLSLVRN